MMTLMIMGHCLHCTNADFTLTSGDKGEVEVAGGGR